MFTTVSERLGTNNMPIPKKIICIVLLCGLKKKHFNFLSGSSVEDPVVL